MHILGLDIGKDTLFAYLILTGGEHHLLAAVPNTAAGFQQLVRWAGKHHASQAELHVVMEATGVYWENCAQHFYEQGCTVSVENPARIRYYALSDGLRGKTDAMDAKLIAQYGASKSPKPWTPPGPALHELKLLVRERSTLMVTLNTLNAEQNRLHAMTHRANSSATLVRLLQERVAFLKAQVESLETAMHTLVEGDLFLCEPLHLLMTIPGYGFLTAASVLAETDGFAVLETGKQIAAYAGIAPAPFESGSSVRGAHFQGGQCLSPAHRLPKQVAGDVVQF